MNRSRDRPEAVRIEEAGLASAGLPLPVLLLRSGVILELEPTERSHG